jgi:hypothetical protein
VVPGVMMHSEYVRKLCIQFGIAEDIPLDQLIEELVKALRSLSVNERSIIETELIIRMSLCLVRHEEREEEEIREILDKLKVLEKDHQLLTAHDAQIRSLNSVITGFNDRIENLQSRIEFGLAEVSKTVGTMIDTAMGYFKQVENKMTTTAYLHGLLIIAIMVLVFTMFAKLR